MKFALSPTFGGSGDTQPAVLCHQCPDDYLGVVGAALSETISSKSPNFFLFGKPDTEKPVERNEQEDSVV